MEMSKALHYTLRRFDPIMVDNEVVSSSAIRALLIQGHVERASRY
jgi:FAD synthase